MLAPKRLGDITGARLSKLAGLLRAEDKSLCTVKNYMAHLKSAMGWAVKVRMLPAVTDFPTQHRAKVQKMMKGRPISEREFKAMLDATPAAVGKAATGSAIRKD